jgi:hypothetical protein
MIDVSAISAAVTSLRALLDLAKAINNAQISSQVVSAVIEAQSQLLNTQQQALELQEENRRLREEISDLKSNALVFPDSGVRWEKQPDGSYYGPLCEACWGFKGSKIRLTHDARRSAADYFVYYCMHHEAPVTVRVPRETLAKYNIDERY